MSKGWVIATIFILYGCATFSHDPEYCSLTPEQRTVVIQNIQNVIAELSDENVTYEVTRSVVDDSKLYKDKGRCWAYLFPKSVKPGYGILDGDGGVYINSTTLQPEGVFWFAY